MDAEKTFSDADETWVQMTADEVWCDLANATLVPPKGRYASHHDGLCAMLRLAILYARQEKPQLSGPAAVLEMGIEGGRVKNE